MLVIGVIAVVWTFMGGITKMSWTDFILFVSMIVGAIISLVAIFGDLPFGFGEMFQQLDGAAKLKLIDVATDPTKTWTVWTGLICFTIFELAQNSVDQVITQRMMCCRNYKEARKAVLGSLGVVVFALLMTAVGLGLWLFYQHHGLDPASAAALAEQPSRVFPHFIVHELPVGVSGLLIAGIFAAGISTLDSALAALSETTANGIYRKWIRPDATEKQCMRISRISVVAWGVALSLLAYLAAKLVQNEGLLDLAYKVPVVTYGPMLMIALLALMRRESFPAILSGSIASVGVAVTLLILRGQQIITLDQLWIYPISCIVFVAITGFVKLTRLNKHPSNEIT